MTSTAPTVQAELDQSDLYAVFATDGDGDTFRVSDVRPWGAALLEWQKLDGLRLDGRLPQTRFFEVRTVALGPDRAVVGPEVRSHDRYDRAPFNLSLARPVVKGRGYGKVEDAARAAWKQFAPTYRARNGYRGVQGLGGWFYYPNGTTAAQGLRDLARVAKRRGLVTQGTDGRWYVTAREAL